MEIRTRIDLLVTDVGLSGGMNGCQLAEAAAGCQRPDGPGEAPSTWSVVVELMLAGRARGTGGYAVAATPVTSAHVWKAWVRAARYSMAGW
jgi:hypothetical protein